MTRYLKNKVYKVESDCVLERIDDKISIFIDTNVWIDVVKNRVPLAGSIKSKLLDLVKSNKIFCPISAPLIWELYKQDMQSQLCIAAFMDSISLGVSYKSTEEIFNTEIKMFIKKLLGAKPLEDIKKYIYIPLSFYLSSFYGISYPAEWTEENILSFEKYFRDAYINISLEHFIKMRQDVGDNPLCGINTLRNPESAKDRWEITKGDRSKLLRIEEESIAKNYLFPYLNKLPIELKLVILTKIKSIPRDKYGGCMQTILESLPALRNHLELMAIPALNPLRKAKSSDFFDLEMLAAPLAYADIVVSQDKWIHDIVCNRGTFLERSKCKYFPNLDTFEEYLVSLG
jgi:hypothetical protein